METSIWKTLGSVTFVCFVGGYLYWSYAHMPNPKANVSIPLAPVVTAPKVDGPKLNVPLKVIPPEEAQKAFPGIPQTPSNPMIDTGKVPDAPNGGKVAVFMNTTTGVASTQFVPNATPWFKFRDQNEFGIGMEIGSHGPRVPVFYNRDILQVKNGFLVLGGGVKIPTELTPERLKHDLEWHFNSNLVVRF